MAIAFSQWSSSKEIISYQSSYNPQSLILSFSQINKNLENFLLYWSSQPRQNLDIDYDSLSTDNQYKVDYLDELDSS